MILNKEGQSEDAGKDEQEDRENDNGHIQQEVVVYSYQGIQLKVKLSQKGQLYSTSLIISIVLIHGR